MAHNVLVSLFILMLTASTQATAIDDTSKNNQTSTVTKTDESTQDSTAEATITPGPKADKKQKEPADNKAGEGEEEEPECD